MKIYVIINYTPHTQRISKIFYLRGEAEEYIKNIERFIPKFYRCSINAWVYELEKIDPGFVYHWPIFGVNPITIYRIDEYEIE